MSAEIDVRALVLRRYDLGDTDRRLILLTEELGKIDAVAKGARKAASRLAGVSDPLCIARLTLATGKRRKFIIQAQPEWAFRGIRHDFDRLQLALSLLELAESILPWEEPAPETWVRLQGALEAVEAHPEPLVAAVWAQVQLLQEAGFGPQVSECVARGTAVAVAQPWFSPRGGGFVSEEAALEFDDRFRTRAEVLYGIAGLQGLEHAPPRLRYAPEALALLFYYWREVAQTRLPATEMCVQQFTIRVGQSG
jgi:DNA repair protein RecO (recombination protein O)